MVRYCPHCWKEAPASAERCPHCGQATDDSYLPFVDRLLATLHHPEPTHAGLAIDILAERLREQRAVEPLVALLATTSDATILKQAAHGLGLLSDRRAVPALARLLADGDAPFVARCEAALALGRLGGDEATQALEGALDDARPSVARAVRQALAMLTATHG
ncbi:MAG: HEAT repeat domain-containing protein [Anaerolineae bacterium]